MPYKGSGPAVADLVGGRVQIMFDAAPSLIQHVRSGKLRVLAAASPQRNRLLPEVPTFAEPRASEGGGIAWYGLLAPAGTPRSILENSTGTRPRRSNPARSEKAPGAGRGADAGRPQAFASFMQEEMAKWAPVVKQAGVKLD